MELRLRPDGVNEVPLERFLAAQAFGHRAEHVGEVAAHLALVDDAGQATGAGQHAEQRHFWQRYGRVVVVDEVDLIAREREFVTTASARRVDRADRLNARVPAVVLEAEPRLVRELAEVHFERMRAALQHQDVGAGAEGTLLATADYQRLHRRVLKPQPRNGVGELHVDPEVVAVELEFVAFLEREVGVDVHAQVRDLAIDLQLPVVVAVRVSVEVSHAACDQRVLVGARTVSRSAELLASKIKHISDVQIGIIVHY